MRRTWLRAFIFQAFCGWIASTVLVQSPPLFASDTLGGLSSLEITPSVGVPLGGYGDLRRRSLPFDFKGSKGILDPLEAKVLILQNGSQRLLLVSVDLIGMTAQFRKDLLQRVASLGFQDGNTLISATHTHSGPGAIVDNLVWEVSAMGRFQSGVYELLIERVAQAIDQAQKDLQPIELFTASFEASGLQRNRRQNPIGFDPKARFLLVRSRSNGSWLGGVLNFAIHGTSLNSKNLYFSADAPGGIRRAGENLLRQMNEKASLATHDSPTLLFINGAEGDVAPAHDGIDGIQALSDSFAEQAHGALENPIPVDPHWFIQDQEVELPRPRIDLSKCGSLAGPRMPLSHWLARKTRIWNLRIGDLEWVTWPGEPTTEVGYRLKDQIGAEAWILGLTNDHLAYFTTEEEYRTKSIETCTNFYGPKGTEALLQAHQRLSSAISNSRSTSAGGPSR